MNLNKIQVVFLFLMLGFASHTSAQYKTEKEFIAEKQKEEQAEKQAAFDKRASSIVGRTFWIKPNPKAIFHISFRDLARRSGSEKFFVTTVNSFTVLGIEKGEDGEHYAKVEFPDGKIGYLELDSKELNIGAKKVKLIPLIEGGETMLDYEEYLYPVPPEQFIAAYQARKNSQKNGAKPKSGVRLGMSVEQVLASNWGKPMSVNKTTTTRGSSEQWVYGSNNYLYFDNGILTSIQN